MLTLRKAEISLEFVIFIGILLIFFIFFFGIIGLKTADINQSSVFTNAQNIANKIANEINIASGMEGYYREFFIPEKLVSGDNYSVNIITDYRIIQLTWNGKSAISNLMTDQISGNATPGSNRIKNEGGVIIIES
jgi:uncharacterized protein (UPF0333 family)